ncbi:MAG: biopolymer transporter ExbD [candidate division Zixibacteria bacterium]|nr:biopolymer transporter ExbD [candidate division Zixibacteria bacterium]
MKMLAKRKRRLSINIDMTPMVDIAFLLLIFYMATTQFKPPEKNLVDLPESHSQVSMPDSDIINVTVTKDDSVFVDYVKIDTVLVNGKLVSRPERVYQTATPITVGGLIIKAREKNRKAFLVLKADRHSSFGTIEAIMSTLRDLNMARFQIITDVERET